MGGADLRSPPNLTAFMAANRVMVGLSSGSGPTSGCLDIWCQRLNGV